MSFGIGVEVVGVDLEFHGTDGLERFRLHDGHVVCCADGRTGDVAACGPSDIGRSGFDFTQNGPHKPLLLHFFCQREGVAAAHTYGFGLADHARRILGAVDRTHADAQLREARLHLLFVLGVRESHGGVGNEDYFAHALKKPAYFRQRITEIFLPGIGRIRDQKQFHKNMVLNRLIVKMC